MGRSKAELKKAACEAIDRNRDKIMGFDFRRAGAWIQGV